MSNNLRLFYAFLYVAEDKTKKNELNNNINNNKNITTFLFSVFKLIEKVR